MTLTINNKPIDTVAANIGELVNELALPQTGVAIALDNKMVPRTEWNTTPLREGTSIVIIKAVCGG